MKVFFRMAVFCCVALANPLVGFAEDKEVSSHLIAKVGGAERADGFKKVYVYSKEPLSSVRYSSGDSETWSWMKSDGFQFGYHIHSTSYQSVEPGKTLRVVGVTSDRIQIIDGLTLQNEDVVEVTGISEKQLSAAPPSEPSQFVLDQNTIHYGSSNIDPQSLAQARANEMARRNSMIHFGGGIVRTTIGTLAEGIGCGGPNCGTCVATNGTAAIGDAQAVGSNGMTYRCRLYKSPGTTSGGGGGGRHFRRR